MIKLHPVSDAIRMIENKINTMPSHQFKIYSLLAIRQYKKPTADRLKLEQVVEYTNINIRPATTAIGVLKHKEIIGEDSLGGYYVIR